MTKLTWHDLYLTSKWLKWVFFTWWKSLLWLWWEEKCAVPIHTMSRGGLGTWYGYCKSLRRGLLCLVGLGEDGVNPTIWLLRWVDQFEWHKQTDVNMKTFQQHLVHFGKPLTKTKTLLKWESHGQGQFPFSLCREFSLPERKREKIKVIEDWRAESPKFYFPRFEMFS